MTALLLALAGCGDSGRSEDAASGGPSAVGSARLGPPTGVQGPGGAQSFAGAAGKRRFESLAGMICRTVREGAPRPPARPLAGAALRRYAGAAGTGNQRVLVSLQRLGAPASLRPQMEGLLGALRRLQSAYAAAGEGAAGRAGSRAPGRAIYSAEARAAAAAAAAGVPLCAPR